MTYESDEPIEVYIEYDGDVVFYEGRALGVLLIEEQVIVNGFVRHADIGKEEIRLFVLCNDIFAWGLADAEPFTFGDIQSVYDAYAADPSWGTVRWCCIRRNEKPQRPVERAMRMEGRWDDVLEALPENGYDASWRREKDERDGKSKQRV